LSIEPELPKVEDEQVLVCEKCGVEVAYIIFFKKLEEICPTCHNQSEPNTNWILCSKCRGLSP